MANRFLHESARKAVMKAAQDLANRGQVHDIMGDAVRDALRSGLQAEALSGVYESLLEVDARASGRAIELRPGLKRKAQGSFYTPDWLVEITLRSSFSPLLRSVSANSIRKMQVLDPACGAGAFLIGAGERLSARLATLQGGTPRAKRQARREVAANCLHGIDKDPVAIELCRAAIRERFGADPGNHLRVGDGLLDEIPPRFDAIIGNPPFLNRLERLTEVPRTTASALKRRFGPAARAYTDLSALFLLKAAQSARPGGCVAMVQPQSILGSRDAAGVREALSSIGRLTHLWLADEHAFDASVFVCVPTIRAGKPHDAAIVPRTLGRTCRSLPPAAVSADSWSALAAIDVPHFSFETRGVIGDIAEVTADFRDEYYGLRGTVVEHKHGLAPPAFPALVSTGLIDAAVCRWGTAPSRFSGRAWTAPRVDISRLPVSLRPWAKRRAVPKVLLATQTRILEAAVDERGHWLPVTPLISISPRTAANLWMIGAALSSPVLSAIGARLGAGTGLSRGAIKLSATQVRTLPLPRRPLNAAAREFTKASQNPGKRIDHLTRAAQHSCAAYEVPVREAKPLVEWWAARLLR